MPQAFEHGAALFNAGRFFEAHEAFEELLDEVEEDRRWDFLVALIQVAVGYHKLVSGHAGASRMLGLGLEKLAAFPDESWGVDVAGLRARVAEDRADLEAWRSVDDRLTADPPRIATASPR